jgi:hypothetical protein
VVDELDNGVRDGKAAGVAEDADELRFAGLAIKSRGAGQDGKERRHKETMSS